MIPIVPDAPHRDRDVSPPRRPFASPSAITAPPRLAVTDLTATYREGGATLTALRGLGFSIAASEFVALIGPSGSGKSTLLDVVAGLVDAADGEVALDGVPLPAARRLGRSSYMRQRDLLLPWRTATENAALGLEAGGVPRRRARAAAKERLPEFGLAAFGDAYPAQLSGGMRQRVAFLRTVLPDRPLLLLDEPFGALDALTRTEMQGWLLDLWERERRSVLLVTHDVEEAIFLADRVLVLSSRPGFVVHEESVALPRPRHRTMVTDPAFLRHKAAILAALGLLDEEPH